MSSHIGPRNLTLNTHDRSRFLGNRLSGPDGSRHSSDRHPKDVNSKIRIIVQFLSGNVCPPEGKLPRCGISVFLQLFEFLSHLPRNSRSSRGRKFRFFVVFVFCGLKLLKACLKAPALTGYVGDAQGRGCNEALLSEKKGVFSEDSVTRSAPFGEAVWAIE